MKNDNFDVDYWSNNNNTENSDEKAFAPSPAGYADHSDTAAEVEEVVNAIIASGVDITQGYGNWLNLGFALADELGEGGRQLYHNLSRLNSEYNPTECDKQYSSCLKGSGRGITIRTFFKMAMDAGIDVGKVGKNVSLNANGTCADYCLEKDKKDNRTSGHNSEKYNNYTQNTNSESKRTDDLLTLLSFSDGLLDNSSYTFSDKLVREDIPSFLHPVYDSQKDAVGRDKMLLGSLNIISGVLPDTLYGIYDHKYIYASLYSTIYGNYASSKGDLEACREIIRPIKMEMRRRYEEEKKEYEAAKAAWESQSKAQRGAEPKEPVLHSPFVTANSSASAVYRCLDQNGGWGVMFETEADTLANMLSKSEYGDYSDLLRKAHHHESIAMVRVSDHVNIEIDKPRLSVLLTCTGSQIPLLLPSSNVANGLASRFLFYALPNGNVGFRDVFDGLNDPIEDTYRRLGYRLMPLYHALQSRQAHSLQFVLSDVQRKEFISTFDAILKEQFSMLGDGINGFIFRIALECFRIAMILTVLRRLSDWDETDSIFDDDEHALICKDTDFRTAMTIINCLVNHTARVYSVLGEKNTDPFAKHAEKPTDELKAFYSALPDNREFKLAEAEEVAINMNVSERTGRRYIGFLVTKYQLLSRIKHGVYVKCSCNNDVC